MKRILHDTLAAIAISAALAGCSQQEDMPLPSYSDDGAIRFAAATEYSRAGDITTGNLKAFNVYAYTGTDQTPKLFMDNVTVTKTGTNTWTYSPVQYWPANESVDFYAFAPSSWVGSSGPLAPVPYSSYPGHEDIVYAVSPDLTGSVGQANAQVIFNFRHALSKVTLKISSSDTKLKVDVSNIALSNIKSKGNFNFPSASTSQSASQETVGNWTDQNTPYAYPMLWSQAPDDHVILTTTPTVIPMSGVSFGSVLYLIPQPLTWRSAGNGVDTYIGVNCVVYDAKTGTKLWPNENTPSEDIVPGSSTGDGILKFPLSTSKFSEWQPGVHYIYNLTINANEEMGTIEFGQPSVEGFVEVETNYD